jgi:AbiV family abortive infection protein
MGSAVTPEFLVQGYAYALEQCGLLLRDANVLYRSRAYPSTVVLTAFAVEELGRSTIMLRLWRRALDSEEITLPEIRKCCSDQGAHHTKQEAGMLSITLNGDEDQPELGKWLRIRMTADPQSAERQEVDAALARIQDQIRKRLPKERHQARIDALYVDPKSETEWKRPLVTISASYATNFLLAAVNDYAGRYHDRYISSSESVVQLQHRDPELYNALKTWSDRPGLPCPEWPGIS